MFLQRDLILYVSTVDTGFTESNTYKLRTLEGIDFDTSVSVSETNTNVINYSLERTAKPYAEARGEATVSFSTYFKYIGQDYSDLLLWNSLTATDNVFPNISFDGANTYQLPQLYVWFEFDGAIYKLSDAVVQQANFKNNVSNIPTMAWTLVGLNLEKVTTVPDTFLDFTEARTYTVGKKSIVAIDDIKFPVTSLEITYTNSLIVRNRPVLGELASPTDIYTNELDIKISLSVYLGNNYLKNLYDTRLSNDVELDATNAIKVELSDNFIFNFPEVKLFLPSLTSGDIMSLELTGKVFETSNAAIEIPEEDTGTGTGTEGPDVLTFTIVTDQPNAEYTLPTSVNPNTGLPQNYNATVNFGDINSTDVEVTSWDDPDTYYTYELAGTYDVIVEGDFDYISAARVFGQDWDLIYVDGGLVTEGYASFLQNRDLLRVTNLDTTAVTDFSYMLDGCWSLEFVPNINTSNGVTFVYTFSSLESVDSFPVLDFSSGIDFQNTFSYIPGITSYPAELDFSSGENFEATWSENYGLLSFPGYNLGNGTNFNWAWQFDSLLAEFPSDINLTSGQSFIGTWNYCYGLTSFPELSFPVAQSFARAWETCTGLISFPALDLSSATEFSYAWQYCTSMEEFPATIDISNGIYFSGTWANCDSFTSFPALNLSQGIEFDYAWAYCNLLASFPSDINLSSGVDFDSAWEGCIALTSFPTLNMPNGESFRETWKGCTSLASFPSDINLSGGINFMEAWYRCSSLTSFPALDLSSGTNFLRAWYECYSLTSVGPLNMSSGEDFSGAWLACDNLISVDPGINFGNKATTFQSAWYQCSSLQNFPPNLFDSINIDTFSQDGFSNTWVNTSGNNDLTLASLLNILNSINNIVTTDANNRTIGVEDLVGLSYNEDYCTVSNELVSKNWDVPTYEGLYVIETTSPDTSVWMSTYDLLELEAEDPLFDAFYYSDNYSVEVDWGDDVITQFVNPSRTRYGHNYAAQGTYVIRVRGPRQVSFGGTLGIGSAMWDLKDGDLNKFALRKFYALKGLDSMYKSFAGLPNLTNGYALDISTVQNMESAFEGALALETLSIVDTFGPAVTFKSAFANCSALNSIEYMHPSRAYYSEFYNWLNFETYYELQPLPNCFLSTWSGCDSLPVSYVNRILLGLANAEIFAPATGNTITIDFDDTTGAISPDASAALNIIREYGWRVVINGIAYAPLTYSAVTEDPYFNQVYLCLPMYSERGVPETYSLDKYRQELLAGDTTTFTPLQSKYYGSSAYFDGTPYSAIGINAVFGIAYGSFSWVQFTERSVTMEAWIYITSYNENPFMHDGGGNTIIDWSRKTNEDGPFNMFKVRTNGELAIIQDGRKTSGTSTTKVGLTISGGSVSLNTWHHVAVTTDKTYMRLWIDGQKVAETTPEYDIAADNYFEGFIGSYYPDVSIGGQYQEFWDEDGLYPPSFVGYMQDVRITQLSRYDENFTPPAALYYTKRPIPDKVDYSAMTVSQIEADNLDDGFVFVIPLVGDNNASIVPGYWDRSEFAIHKYPTDQNRFYGWRYRHITTHGGFITQTTEHKYYDSAGYFDGIDSYLSMDMATNTFAGGYGDVTSEMSRIEAWIYITTYNDNPSKPFGGGNPIFDMSCDAVDCERIFRVTPAGALAYQVGAVEVLSGGSIPLNTWTHVSLSFAENVFTKLFIDGIEVATTSYSNNQFKSTTAEGKIGASFKPQAVAADKVFFTGYMQDVLFKSKVDSDPRTANFTPPGALLPINGKLI